MFASTTLDPYRIKRKIVYMERERSQKSTRIHSTRRMQKTHRHRRGSIHLKTIHRSHIYLQRGKHSSKKSLYLHSIIGPNMPLHGALHISFIGFHIFSCRTHITIVIHHSDQDVYYSRNMHGGIIEIFLEMRNPKIKVLTYSIFWLHSACVDIHAVVVQLD